MFKKTFLFLVVLILMAALNMGFLNKRISLDSIKSPDSMLMMGNQHEKEIIALSTQLQQLQSTNGSAEDQQKIQNQLQEYSYTDTISIEDKEFVNKLLSDIKDSSGVVVKGNLQKPKNGITYIVQFNYNNVQAQTSQEYIDNLTKGYLPSIYILPTSEAVIPTYDKKTPDQIVIVEAKLSKATMKYVNDYYNAKKVK